MLTSLRWICATAFAVAMVCALNVAAQAQQGQGGYGGGNGGGWRGGDGGGGWRGGDGGGGGGFRGGDGGGGGFDRRAMMLDRIQQMDENRNGVIEPDEMQNGRGRFFIMAAAREAGMDPTQPMSVERLKTALQNSPRFNGGGDNSGANPAATPGATPKPEDKAATKKPPIFSFPSNVPGFGLPTDAVKVQGFGDAMAANTAAATTSSTTSSTTPSTSTTPAASAAPASSTTSSGSSTPAASEPSQEERVRNFADAYLKQRDTDKSEALEKSKDEWKDIRGDPEQIDADHNGIITLEELIARFSNRQRLGGGGGGGGQGGGDRPADANAAAPGKSPVATTSGPAVKAKRFLTPTERLPAGLPSWFTSYDKNGDGQVSMAEYSSTWTEAKVAEFAKYDLDHDGFITPQECLKVEKK